MPTYLKNTSRSARASATSRVPFPLSSQPFLPVSIILPGIKEPIFVNTEDPEYYSELLKNAHGLPPDERLRVGSCSDVPLAVNWRLQTLLDIVASISLCQQKNISATMASLKVNEVDKGTLETRLYIIFDHKDEAFRSCARHLQSIFNMLRQVPYEPPSMEGSPVVVSDELKHNLIEICGAIHNYSFEIFAHRVTKRKHRLSDIWTYIKEDRSQFSDEQHSTLTKFLRHVEAIIAAVANAQATRRLSAFRIEMLVIMYSYWTHHNILPKDGLADNNLTVLDFADHKLAESA
jgi:hypothetical protein